MFHITKLHTWRHQPSPLPIIALLILSSCENGSSPTDGGDSQPPSPYVPVTEYCAQVVDSYCSFYLRCGRMAAQDHEQCRTRFMQTCTGVYQPRYQALAQAGNLTLSRQGIKACAAHLAAVSCEQQLSDLQGPCGSMWEGTVPLEGACSFGIESLVCAPESVCILDLTFCGTCRPVATAGESCDAEAHCRYPDACSAGVCVAAALPGESCAGDRNCVSGAVCSNEVCQAIPVVQDGESCDRSNRCVYGTSCIAGKCRLNALLDEACAADTPCDAGYCDELTHTCTSFIPSGQACSADETCLSGRCEQNVCAPLISACFDEE